MTVLRSVLVTPAVRGSEGCWAGGAAGIVWRCPSGADDCDFPGSILDKGLAHECGVRVPPFGGCDAVGRIVQLEGALNVAAGLWKSRTSGQVSGRGNPTDILAGRGKPWLPILDGPLRANV